MSYFSCRTDAHTELERHWQSFIPSLLSKSFLTRILAVEHLLILSFLLIPFLETHTSWSSFFHPVLQLELFETMQPPLNYLLSWNPLPHPHFWNRGAILQLQP
uniref:Orf102a n=1 Tax=Batis maritima TaxID=4436 RepID=A0A068BBL5_BATMA|nr:orf102a [Batis maritima]AIC83320.1 orf102a [Batis maritima]